jgi:hypothetical protein
MVVSVAQLAEHRVVASVVEGSSPFTHPNFSQVFTERHGGPLAQLVEQLTLNQRVRSSSLRRPTRQNPSKVRQFSAVTVRRASGNRFVSTPFPQIEK